MAAMGLPALEPPASIAGMCPSTLAKGGGKGSGKETHEARAARLEIEVVELRKMLKARTALPPQDQRNLALRDLLGEERREIDVDADHLTPPPRRMPLDVSRAQGCADGRPRPAPTLPNFDDDYDARSCVTATTAKSRLVMPGRVMVGRGRGVFFIWDVRSGFWKWGGCSHKCYWDS